MKLQVPEPPSNRPSSAALAVPSCAGQRDAREEGRARGADAGVGGAQLALGLQDVGTAHQHLGRHAGRQGLHRGERVGQLRRQQALGHRHAGEQRERVLVLRHQRGVARHVGACGLQQGFGLAQVERRHRAGIEAALRQLVRFLPGLEGAARQRQALAVGGKAQPGVGDFGHQADLRTAARFLGAEIGLQRLFFQAAHAAEEVQFVRREAEAGAVLAADRRLAGGVEVARHALRALAAAGGDGREQVGALDAVQRARALDVERGDAQVAVVFEREFDHLAQARIGEVVAPADVGGQRREGGCLGRRRLRKLRRHRRGRTLIGRDQRACAEQGGGHRGDESTDWSTNWGH